MPDSAPDLLGVDRGSITAPAGCGKTHLIAGALQQHQQVKPVLVLTHTNAGVAALRQRLALIGVRRDAYRIATLDGWAMRVAGTYTGRSGLAPRTFELQDPRTDYPAIRNGVIELLRGRHIEDILSATYDRLIVDEYQDCAVPQHHMVTLIAQQLPVCILGDPMQAIFGWRGNEPPDWENEVLVQFPAAGELTTPWRWMNEGTGPFGQWLLEARKILQAGGKIDLRTAPEEVAWVHLDGTDDEAKKISAAYTPPMTPRGSVLLIAVGTNPRIHRTYASRVSGAVVVENADLGGFADFAHEFDIRAEDAVEKLIEFAGSVLTGVGGAQAVQRIRSLRAGTARTPPSAAEKAALDFVAIPTPENAVALLVRLNDQPEVRAHRASVFRACIKAFNLCADGSDFYDCAVRVREEGRHIGRSIPKRAVGSTLLLKGLEAEVSVVLDADELDAKNLYVAITRGSKRLVVCSSSPVLPLN